ncbi:conserved hypothetical protein [uncultured delta proteobacterium]|uniref:TraB/GumN family protein n=1 Tax=uncultured delta proteobacterium TaxID=34034 RepID=A0A212IUH3_9DELT|nr:conserved hypothetical protein [uncultured delta proteobacterium]
MDMNVIERTASHATVPEHSAAFMEAMSGGKAFLEGGYVFYAAGEWLIGVGYPLADVPGGYSPAEFFEALTAARRRTNARDCWVIAPELPAPLAAHEDETDVFYTLPSDALPPKGLTGPLRKAATLLRIEEGKEFTAGHRRLWAEFLRRKELRPNIRELFARTPQVLAAPGTDIRLLNAWDENGRLAACLVLDYVPAAFVSYIIGAHSREAYVPHASDLLFAAMLQNARESGKRAVHLGLGVNDGIRRFKEKWGGEATLPYRAASWKNNDPQTFSGQKTDIGKVLVGTLFAEETPQTATPAGTVLFGKRLPPEQRPYAMLWKLEKNGKTSWIGGTAHAFRYSFASSFRKLFAETDTVIFEGPLDPASMAAFSRQGYARDAETPRIADLLTEAEIRCLERVVRGPENSCARFLNMCAQNPADVRRILGEARPWCVFFTLWHAFLERHGWHQSVDLEAWRIAHEMNRVVLGMESIEEQTASLESVPLDRILRFLRNAPDWKNRMRHNARAYLDGDLHGMLGTSTEFPTRTEQVIGMRDQRFRERMRPYIEAGRTAVFVGTAHMLNLEKMLREDGFTVTQIRPTVRHKLRALFK